MLGICWVGEDGASLVMGNLFTVILRPLQEAREIVRSVLPFS